MCCKIFIDIFSLFLMSKASYGWKKPFWTVHSFRRKRGECVGNTRAGKGTLLMIAVDENGTPLNDVVASASVHEQRYLHIFFDPARPVSVLPIFDKMVICGRLAIPASPTRSHPHLVWTVLFLSPAFWK